MIDDLFENCVCRICGNDRKFQRLEILPSDYGTDFLCQCLKCETLFIRVYERQVQNG